MIRLGLLLLCLAPPALAPSVLAAQTLPALHDVTGVAANDSLNIRAAPDAGAQALGRLPPDASGVEVVGLSADGRWGRINTGETSGWVALRYLARQPGPDWTEMQSPLACYGTEPFWAVTYAPARRQLTLTAMDAAEITLDLAWQSPVSGRSGLIGWQLSGAARQGFATLRATSCTDGMSDRELGIAVELFLNQRDGSTATATGLSGCCRLIP